MHSAFYKNITSWMKYFPPFLSLKLETGMEIMTDLLSVLQCFTKAEANDYTHCHLLLWSSYSLLTDG